MALVVLMVFVGGYTRLSGSGLSITSWKPIHGSIPPLDEAQWQEEFDAYKNSPQYKQVNSDMTLEGFKTIFWPEFIHRLLGRIIGAVFFFPLIFFTWRGSISKNLFWKLFAIFALGGLQGAIGWIMVKSGLNNSPHVSHIKLALHLGMAFLILALILWVFMGLRGIPWVKARNSWAIFSYKLWFALLSVQIIFGAFMAGLHAGLIHNTWPDMDGEIFPAGTFSGNLLENIAFVQFIHRTLAIFIVCSFLLWCYRYKEYIKINKLTKCSSLILGVIFIQFILGVFTLIHQVPLNAAIAHQLTALILWIIAVVMLYKLSHDKNNKTDHLKLVK
jgi:cytochrome c oxidase assembly protein subunit 15